MPSLHVAEKTELWELEGDLSSVACHAAIELDNLLLGKATDLKEVQRLIRTIADVIPSVQEPSSIAPMLKNATTVVLIKRALHDSHPGTSVTKVDELVTHAKQIAESLNQLVINPKAFTEIQSDELHRMRSFCVALSKHALGSERSRYQTKPEHPFRR